jgi:thiamine pyrophosphate-dependent acetolactate synthase large subunit-like protein
MGKYYLEIYEICTNRYSMEASSLKEAVEKYRNGESSVEDGGPDYVAIGEGMGFEGIRSVRTPDGEEIHWDALERRLEDAGQKG